MKGELRCLLFPFLILFASSCKNQEDAPFCGSHVSAFLGAWNITEECASNEYGYLLTIAENPSGGIKLQNLGDGGPNSVLSATLDGSNGFVIPAQSVQGITVSGNGSLNDGCRQLVIQWSGWKGACTASGTK